MQFLLRTPWSHFQCDFADVCFSQPVLPFHIWLLNAWIGKSDVKPFTLTPTPSFPQVTVWQGIHTHWSWSNGIGVRCFPCMRLTLILFPVHNWFSEQCQEWFQIQSLEEAVSTNECNPENKTYTHIHTHKIVTKPYSQIQIKILHAEHTAVLHPHHYFSGETQATHLKQLFFFYVHVKLLKIFKLSKRSFWKPSPTSGLIQSTNTEISRVDTLQC